MIGKSSVIAMSYDAGPYGLASEFNILAKRVLYIPDDL